MCVLNCFPFTTSLFRIFHVKYREVVAARQFTNVLDGFEYVCVRAIYIIISQFTSTSRFASFSFDCGSYIATVCHMHAVNSVLVVVSKHIARCKSGEIDIS